MLSGLDAGSVVLFDSTQGVPMPFEGVISEGPAVRIQFITDKPNNQNTGFNIHYEGELPYNMHINMNRYLALATRLQKFFFRKDNYIKIDLHIKPL